MVVLPRCGSSNGVVSGKDENKGATSIIKKTRGSRIAGWETVPYLRNGIQRKAII